ncbi:alpha/beta fold hydrolase [Streptomyces sp. NPDC047043]|uniref:alpha/beta fold hydrolase n=1 Tax=unclassified Streptomyces TaxID=2593676 RepID=UPI0033D8A577
MSAATPATPRSTVWADLLGSEVRWYDAGGIRTRCVEAGDGPPLILLHGVGGHAEAFARNVVPLSEHFRVLAVDLLGSGLTDKPEGPADLDAYLSHMTAFMDAAGVEKAHFGGESLGGWIAMWLALRRPERVDNLVSICGARLMVETDPESRKWTDAGRDELRRLTDQFVKDPTRENTRRRMEWLFHKPERDLSEELVDIRWRMYQRTDAVASMKESGKMLGKNPERKDGLDFTPDVLKQVTHRTLMLWSSHNPSNTAATAERAAAYLPDCEFQVMDDCGHWPQWEDPETFNRILTDFLPH